MSPRAPLSIYVSSVLQVFHCTQLLAMLIATPQSPQSSLPLLSHATLPIPNNTLPRPKYLQEDDLTEECKTLISTLPKDQGWVATQLYQYQGFWHASRQLQGVLTCQRHFQAHDSDLILTTSPKCGTTWLKALAYAVRNRKTYPPKGENHPFFTHNPHDLVPFLELKVFVDHQVPNLASLPSPRVFSTHLPVDSLPESIKESGCKIVYLARDPKDAFISLWHFANKLRPQNGGQLSLEEAFDKFCKGVSLYGPFWDHVMGYWNYSKEKPNKVLVLKYEDLKKQPILNLKKLAEFWGYPFTIDEENDGIVEEILKLCSFNNLSNLEVNKKGKLSSGEDNSAFFRKGEIGDWTNYFTQEMTEKFNEINDKKLHLCGLKF